MDEASTDDWRFTKLQAAQAAGMDTVGTIMQWYGRALTFTPTPTLTPIILTPTPIILTPTPTPTPTHQPQPQPQPNPRLHSP